MAAELRGFVLEREFESVDPNGKPGVIKLRIGVPYLDASVAADDFAKWRCKYQLTGIGSEKVREARGVDSIDALLTSLRLAEVHLKANSDFKITWFGEDYLGLLFSPPAELADQERDILAASSSFEAIFDDFFARRQSKRKDASG